MDSEDVLGDLISTYLLPEVERRQSSRKAELKDRRFMKEAHQAMIETIKKTMQADSQADHTDDAD